MKKAKLIRISLPLVLACTISAGTMLHAAEPDPQEAAIAKTAAGFVEAFDKGDAKAVAAFWAVDGDYVDDSGRVLKGRKAIEESFAELFSTTKGLTVRIDVAALKFPTPDVAIEDGTTTVMSPDGVAPSRARYTNVLVKKDDQWLLSSVRESADNGPSNYEFLKDLEWTIGEWVDDASGREIGHIDFTWAPGQNFIISTRTVDYKNSSLLQSTQWIAWDASVKAVRSWSFQTDGGFGESTWRKDGKKWIIKSEAVLADGGKVISTNVVEPGADNTLTWYVRDQKVNGEAVPDTTPVKMKRLQ